MGHATASTVPGCRLPHFWVSPRVSIYDELGPVYTLLCFNGAKAKEPFTGAFAAAGLPLKVMAVGSQPSAYDRKYVLARTDQHVAWRGDVLPDNVQEFVVRCGGRAKD